jgi:hypothetical protein
MRGIVHPSWFSKVKNIALSGHRTFYVSLQASQHIVTNHNVPGAKYIGDIREHDRHYWKDSVVSQVRKARVVWCTNFMATQDRSMAATAVKEWFEKQSTRSRLFRVDAHRVETWLREWQEAEKDRSWSEWRTKRDDILTRAKEMDNPVPEYLVRESDAFRRAMLNNDPITDNKWAKIMVQLDAERAELGKINIYACDFPQMWFITKEVFETENSEEIKRQEILIDNQRLWSHLYPEDLKIVKELHDFGFIAVRPRQGLASACIIFGYLVRRFGAAPSLSNSNAPDLTQYPQAHWITTLRAEFFNVRDNHFPDIHYSKLGYENELARNCLEQVVNQGRDQPELAIKFGSSFAQGRH